MSDLDPESLSSLKVAELKSHLKKRGLAVAGLKQALIGRLREAVVKEIADAEEPEQDEEPEEEEPEAAPEDDDAAPTAADDAAAEMDAALDEARAEDEAEKRSAEAAKAEAEHSAANGETGEKVDAPAVAQVDVAEEPAGGKTEAEEAVQEVAQVAKVESAVDDDQEDSSLANEPESKSAPTPPETQQKVESVPAIEATDKPESPVQKAVEPTPPQTQDETVMTEVQEAVETEPAVKAESATEIKQAPVKPAKDDDVPMEDVQPTSLAIETEGEESLKRKRRSPTPDVSQARLDADLDGDHAPHAKKHRSGDARFKGLFNEGPTAPEAPLPAGEDDDDIPVVPAIHPATRALYVRNFLRPINELSLKQHIASLATRDETAEPTSTTIETFFISSIKDHCLMLLSSTTEAIRVRAGLHNRTWPNEKQRKPLWADFLPEERVAEWIETERSRGGKWEVSYTPSADGGCECTLIEGGGATLGGGAGGVRPGGGRNSIDISKAPTGPRRFDDRRDDPRARFAQNADRAEYNQQGQRVVKNLDELFYSTRCKPKLYWLPVERAVAERRLREKPWEKAKPPSGPPPVRQNKWTSRAPWNRDY